MPQITAIKETKKGRLALFLDGEFAFSLDEETFAAADLHVEDELDAWQLEELRRKSDTRKAIDRALDILALRDHAAGELYQKLCRKSFLLILNVKSLGPTPKGIPPPRHCVARILP